jgi:hypothetical protein
VALASTSLASVLTLAPLPRGAALSAQTLPAAPPSNRAMRVMPRRDGDRMAMSYALKHVLPT